MANQNAIITDTWSNPDSEALYRNEWPDEPAIRAQKLEGDQCGGCSYFAPFNLDFGLCCHPASRHFRETVRALHLPRLPRRGMGRAQLRRHRGRRGLTGAGSC